MSNQEQPCSAGASGPAMQQQPLLYPTPQQNVVTSAPRVFCHSAPGVQPQVLPYQEQPTATFTQPYVPLVTAPLGAAIPSQYPPPNSFLILSILTLIICGFLNLTTIIFGIPALLFSLQSEDCKRQLQYSSAKSKGNIALVLTLINIIYTAVTICLVIGLSVGYTRYYYYY